MVGEDWSGFPASPAAVSNRLIREASIHIGSMYGIYANIGGILMVNVTIYSMHGSYGVRRLPEEPADSIWKNRSDAYRCSYGHLPVISGDFYGILHSISMGFSSYFSLVNGHNWSRCISLPLCDWFDPSRFPWQPGGAIFCDRRLVHGLPC